MSKYALVTGGSRGIGRAIVIRLAKDGYQVIINYASNQAEAEKTLEQIQGQGELLPFDVSNAEQVKEALQGWQQRHPEDYIEVVVNNAGIRRDNVMALMPEADWHRVLDITLSGFFNVTQPLLPAMQLHKFGRIVNMASVSGLKGLPGQTNYSAAKGGIIAATKALAQEVARKNVTVNAVAPGPVLPPEACHERAGATPLGRHPTPQEVADAVAYLLSAESVTGVVLPVDSGQHLLP